MSSTNPPPEAQRFGRSQTPESPRPVHIPEPANIPVLLNQMDPVFNDTATYNIPHNQTFSPYADPTSDQGIPSSGVDELDAVQNFFREAEHQAIAEPEPGVKTAQDAPLTTPNVSTEANSLPPLSIVENPIGQQEQAHIPNPTNITTNTIPANGGAKTTDAEEEISNPKEQGPDNLSTTRMIVDRSHEALQEEPSLDPNPEGGVDYQSLLDTISQSASSAPAANGLTALTTAASSSEDISRPLPHIPGLPPKPPPQEHPVDFPSYSSYDNALVQNQSTGIVSTAANLNAVSNSVSNNEPQLLLSEQIPLQSSIPQLYPPPPGLSAYGQASASKVNQISMVPNQVAPGQDKNRSQDPSERPWSPRTQLLYDQFLEDERRYVTEGIWDKFPNGSRLFVGNLPSEKVTKRDLFHKFHKHGQLAQISIKQAYGFVQFLEAASCSAAMNAEQGVEIRGRKVHLEVSKPQKNTRNAGGGGGGSGGGGNKNQQRRRSRSPDRAARRDTRNYSDFRDEPGRRREEFRNRRSPSPRGYRQRDDYRSTGRDTRSRSPLYGATSQVPISDDEASLQLPRRDPRSVPDVQLLVLETEVVQSFINWVEQGFRSKNVQASTIWVNNRFPLPAVIKRQIIEGVQAVVKLTRASQTNSKIPLQVFDRSAGASNVKFDEYIDLEVPVAADVVIQARQKERGGLSAQHFHPQTFPPQSYQPSAPYATPQPPVPYPQQPTSQFPSQQHGQPPQYAYSNSQQGVYRPPTQPPTPTGQPPNLQQLLANLRQTPGHSAPQGMANTAQNGQPANFPGFLGNFNAQQQYSQAQQPSYGQYASGTPQQGTQPNVQNIMEQLARYQR